MFNLSKGSKKCVKVYVTVPYAQKEKAKDNKACWDPTLKMWFFRFSSEDIEMGYCTTCNFLLLKIVIYDLDSHLYTHIDIPDDDDLSVKDVKNLMKKEIEKRIDKANKKYWNRTNKN